MEFELRPLDVCINQGLTNSGPAVVYEFIGLQAAEMEHRFINCSLMQRAQKGGSEGGGSEADPAAWSGMAHGQELACRSLRPG